MDIAQSRHNDSHPMQVIARLGMICVLLSALPACPPKKGGGTEDAGQGADAGQGEDAGTSDGYVRPAPVTIPPAEPPRNYSDYPKDSLCRPIIARGATLYLHPRAPDPLTALAACTGMITRCLQPPERSLDACVISTPRCTTSQPWMEPECCPEACVTAFETRRRAQVDSLVAFDETFFAPPSCMLGVDALTGGK